MKRVSEETLPIFRGTVQYIISFLLPYYSANRTFCLFFSHYPHFSKIDTYFHLVKMTGTTNHESSSPLSQFLRGLKVTASSVVIADNARTKKLSQEALQKSHATSSSSSSSSSACPSFAIAGEKEKKQRRTEMVKNSQQKVSFNPKVTIAEYCFHSKTEDLFYTRQEYSSMKRDIYATVMRHNQKDETSWDGAHDCLRGLEAFLDDAKEEILRTRLHANLAVMTEQNRQWYEEGHMTPIDSDEMSRRYQRVSLGCQRKARQRGMDVQREICEMLQQSDRTRTTKRRKRSLRFVGDVATAPSTRMYSLSPSAA
jgi:hypothetical protein